MCSRDGRGTSYPPRTGSTRPSPILSPLAFPSSPRTSTTTASPIPRSRPMPPSASAVPPYTIRVPPNSGTLHPVVQQQRTRLVDSTLETSLHAGDARSSPCTTRGAEVPYPSSTTFSQNFLSFSETYRAQNKIWNIPILHQLPALLPAMVSKSIISPTPRTAP